jgi:hypothetical protein
MIDVYRIFSEGDGTSVRIDASRPPDLEAVSQNSVFSDAAPPRRRFVGFPVLLPMLFSLSISTPVGLQDPTSELRGSGAASVWRSWRRRRQRMSLRDARLLALHVLADTERRLENERLADFLFFVSLDDERSTTSL